MNTTLEFTLVVLAMLIMVSGCVVLSAGLLVPNCGIWACTGLAMVVTGLCGSLSLGV